MGITLGQALKSIFTFCTTQKPSNCNDEEHDNTGEEDTLVKCPKCSNVMRMVNTVTSDFITLHIFQCGKCKSVSEFQYDNHTSELVRETHIYTSSATDAGSFSEVYGSIPYDNFSLDRLWSISGHLCYPALIKSEFAGSDKNSLIFIRIDNAHSSNFIDGFMINDQDIVGEIKIVHEQNISQFYNPYLSNLPNPDFDYISSPTVRCEALESVHNIRYRHTIEGHNGIYVHRLKIIKDIPLKVCGLEVYVKFTSINLSNNIPMRKLIKMIDLESIILGKDTINVNDKFAIQTYYLTKYMVSCISRANINKEMRKLFYSDIKDFFTKHDSVSFTLKDDEDG